MSLQRSPHVSINSRTPWEGDPFDREMHGQRLYSLISTLEDHSYVVALHGGWGTGKTIFLRRLRHYFESSTPKIPFVYLDAWLSDDAEDPLIPFIAALNARLSTVEDEAHRGAIAKLRDVGAKLGVPVGALLAHVVAPGSGDIVTAAATLGQGLIDWQSARADTAREFREALTLARDLLTRREPGRPVKPIVVALDELDRCKPDFSVRALERIKHFFNVPGVVFLIATDTGNLPAAVNAVYGPKMDGERYLRRFFDYEYSLPPPTPMQYAKVLWREFGLERVFEGQRNLNQSNLRSIVVEGREFGRLWPSHQMQIDEFDYQHCFSVVAESLDLGLRDQSQAFTMLSAHLRTTRSTHRLPLVDCFLVCLRFASPELYRQLRVGKFIYGLLTTQGGGPAYESVPELRQFASGAYGLALGEFFKQNSSAEMLSSVEQRLRILRAQDDRSALIPLINFANRLEHIENDDQPFDPRSYVTNVLGLVDAFQQQASST